MLYKDEEHIETFETQKIMECMIKVRFDTCMWSGAAISYITEHKEGNA